MKNVVRAVKGTLDYYPEEMAVRTWLYKHMRQVSESFGYEEYDGPFLETLELYAAKSSEEIVEKQSYVFEDRSGERITLRPELTPTLARMVAKRQAQLTFPLRWWSFGPFWRYERPQKGRSREFFQWNIDLIGDGSPEADAELIAIAATFLREIGLKANEVQILVNDRRLMDEQTAALGIFTEMRLHAYRVIDRRDKMKPDAWEAYAREVGLTNAQLEGITLLLEDKELWQKSEEMQRLFKTVEAYGVNDYVQFAPQIIRGFDYYTGTVFEAWDTAGDFRALFGGGRYDNLVDDVGGQPVEAVGFAVGNMVIALLLEKLGRLPVVGQTPAPVFMTIFDETHYLPAISFAHTLRQQGLKVAAYPVPTKLSKQLKYADRVGAKVVLILGPDEHAKGKVTIKHLTSGDQQTVVQSEAANLLRKLLEADNSS